MDTICPIIAMGYCIREFGGLMGGENRTCVGDPDIVCKSYPDRAYGTPALGVSLFH